MNKLERLINLHDCQGGVIHQYTKPYNIDIQSMSDDDFNKFYNKLYNTKQKLIKSGQWFNVKIDFILNNKPITNGSK